jgi:hypothetical protein
MFHHFTLHFCGFPFVEIKDVSTLVVKSAKLYILKDKLTSFKMKDDESVPEMFHILQVIINDLKALGEKINNDDVSH